MNSSVLTTVNKPSGIINSLTYDARFPEPVVILLEVENHLFTDALLLLEGQPLGRPFRFTRFHLMMPSGFRMQDSTNANNCFK